jgi:hypothetical protein
MAHHQTTRRRRRRVQMETGEEVMVKVMVAVAGMALVQIAPQVAAYWLKKYNA